MTRASCLFGVVALITGCSGLVSPDESRLDPDNATADGGRRDLGRPDGNTPDGSRPDGSDPDTGGEGDCTGDGDCNDSVDCTLDTCVDGFCQFTADDTRCVGDDPNPCTSGVFCDRTEGCRGIPRDCDDGIGCTEDRCEVAAGGCVYSDACEDGDTCDPALGCTGGECARDEDCSDGDACTDDRCVGRVCQRPVRACPPTGNPCQGSVCDSDSGDCVAVDVPNGTPCPDDGNLCTTGEACMDGFCLPRGNVPCGDSPGPCTTAVCDPTTGTCAARPVAAGAPCDDGDPCTTGTVCDGGGGCGNGAGCLDDGNPCTDEHCTGTGCISEDSPDGNPCPSSTGAAAGACCGGGCTDLSIDSANCGGCGIDCGDALCIDGVCAECEGDFDCPSAGSPCVEARCRSGFCEFEVTTGFCFIGGSCFADGMQNPANQCLACDPDITDREWTVRFMAPCSDGRWCTLVAGTPDPDNVGMDRCSNDGRCAGSNRGCGDSNQCTRDACNEDTNQCDHFNRDGACSTAGTSGVCCAPPTGGAAMCLPGLICPTGP